MNQKTFTYFSWTTVIISLLLPVYIWGTSYDWDIGSLTAYQWFPLFGLWAWMIMATHYFTGVFRVRNTSLEKPNYYSSFTEYFVLASLLLHPGLLIYAQFRNGAGLPPGSYVSYVGESMQLAVFLGTFALVLFLSFEFFNRARNNKTVEKYWWAVSISQTIAMILIFIHGLRLGSSLQSGWFLYVWIIYGLLLLPCFYISHKNDFKTLSE